MGSPLIKGWASDIQVAPWQVSLDKLFEEEASNEHSTHSISNIGDIGDRGVEGGAKLLRQRHWPEELATCPSSGQELIPEAIVIGHDSAGTGTKSNNLGTSEGRNVDETIEPERLPSHLR